VTLWHERDISHSSAERVIIPDSTTLLDYMLNKFSEVLEGLVVYPEKMEEDLEITGGLIF
jgi:adenylosuccinate lyase